MMSELAFGEGFLAAAHETVKSLQVQPSCYIWFVIHLALPFGRLTSASNGVDHLRLSCPCLVIFVLYFLILPARSVQPRSLSCSCSIH